MKQIFVNLTLSYLRFWAKKALARHQPTIIGIAGSVGKSSTRNAIEAVLKDHFPTKSVGNSETGIPLGILGMKPENYSKFDWIKMLLKSPFNLNYLKGTKYLIAEMGIDDPYPPKNMEYLLTILKPEIAVSLNVSVTHSQQFDKTLSATHNALSEKERRNLVIEKIAEEDTKIITQSGCSLGIYNADDEYISSAIARSKTTKQARERKIATSSESSRNDDSTKLQTFGTKSSNDISFLSYSVSLRGTEFIFSLKTSEGRQELALHFSRFVLPEEYREVFAAAILTALSTGLNHKQIKESLEKNYILPKGRASIFNGINDSRIIDSSYNASKASMLAFLDLVDILKKESDRPVVMLFGDMRELGEESRIEHEEVAKKLAGIVDYLYLVGPQTREFVLPIIQKNEKYFSEVRWFDSSVRAGEFMEQTLPHNALVLVKGSQNTIFLEESIRYILANQEDKSQLCRQEPHWLAVKDSHFRKTVSR